MFEILVTCKALTFWLQNIFVYINSVGLHLKEWRNSPILVICLKISPRFTAKRTPAARPISKEPLIRPFLQYKLEKKLKTDKTELNLL